MALINTVLKALLRIPEKSLEALRHNKKSQVALRSHRYLKDLKKLPRELA